MHVSPRTRRTRQAQTILSVLYRSRACLSRVVAHVIQCRSKYDYMHKKRGGEQTTGCRSSAACLIEPCEVAHSRAGFSGVQACECVKSNMHAVGDASEHLKDGRMCCDRLCRRRARAVHAVRAAHALSLVSERPRPLIACIRSASAFHPRPKVQDAHAHDVKLLLQRVTVTKRVKKGH